MKTFHKGQIVYYCIFIYSEHKDIDRNITYTSKVITRVIDAAGTKKITFFGDSNSMIYPKTVYIQHMEIQQGIAYLHNSYDNAIKALRLFADRNSCDGINKIHPNKYIKSVKFELIA